MNSFIFLVLASNAELNREARRRHRNRNRHPKRLECYDRSNPGAFTGGYTTTVNGHTCQKWNSNTPHVPRHRPDGDRNHNKCRNPDNDPNGPWCYTTNPDVRYDYCNVKNCDDQNGKEKVQDVTCLASNDPKGLNYRGTHRFAVADGQTFMCQSWNAVEPHRSMYLMDEKHNYCRNPNNDVHGPWCYLNDKRHKKGFCTGIPLCEGRRRKSGTCGVPAFSPEFRMEQKPTQLRTRRDTEHVQNAHQLYNKDNEYAYYDSYETSDVEVTPREKQFVRELQNGSGTNTGSRIVGGQEATPHSYPWQISLRYRDERLAFCGGSVISDRWVLTAAHCVMDEPTNRALGDHCFAAVPNLEIYAGTHSKMGTKSEDSSKQVRGIKQFCNHPKWDDENIYGDAALLELKSPLVINKYVMPICLPDVDVIIPSDTMCVITGFGRTQGTANENVLNQQTMPIVSNSKCNQYLGHGTVPDNSQMCAGYEKGGVDTCQGDSGGPLACKHGEEWIIDGITSWGYGCGDPRSPGVYTRVSSHVILTWIKNKTGL